MIRKLTHTPAHTPAKVPSSRKTSRSLRFAWPEEQMRGKEIWREAWRDFTTGAGRVLLTAAVFLATVGVISALIGFYGGHIARSAVAFRHAGASVSILNAPGQIDPQRCVDLAQVGHIQAAGALRASSDLVFAVMPNRPIASFEATPSLWQVLANSAANAEYSEQAGIWITDTLAETLGAQLGDEFALADGRQATVSGIFAYPDDGRNRDLGYAVVSPVSPGALSGKFDECRTEIWPLHQADTQMVRLAVTSAGGGEDAATIGQLNPKMGADFTDAQGWWWLVRLGMGLAVLAGFAIGFSWIRTRRLTLASALHSGVTKLSLSLICLAQSALCLGLAFIAWLPVGWYVSAYDAAPDPWVSFIASLESFWAGATGYLLGTLASLAFTKEKHLFRYFKSH